MKHKHIIHYPNGQKEMEQTLTDGIMDGLFTMWYANGQKESEWTYKGEDSLGGGMKQGKETTWYENGQMEREATYKNGELISEKYWDEDGNEKDCN